MSDNQAVPSWMQTLRTLEKKLEENGVKQSSFLNKYENVWSNILVLYYTNDKRHLWNHPYAIRARNASLTSETFRQYFVMLKITREMEDLMDSIKFLQTQIVHFEMRRKGGETVNIVSSSSEENNRDQGVLFFLDFFERDLEVSNDLETLKNIFTDTTNFDKLKNYFRTTDPKLSFTEDKSIFDYVTINQEQFLDNKLLLKMLESIEKKLEEVTELVKKITGHLTPESNNSRTANIGLWNISPFIVNQLSALNDQINFPEILNTLSTLIGRSPEPASIMNLDSLYVPTILLSAVIFGYTQRNKFKDVLDKFKRDNPSIKGTDIKDTFIKDLAKKVMEEKKIENEEDAQKIVIDMIDKLQKIMDTKLLSIRTTSQKIFNLGQTILIAEKPKLKN